MRYYMYDDNRFYLHESESDAPLLNATLIPPMQPCWCPRWDGSKWVEEAPPPTDYDRETEIAVWDAEAKEWRIEPIPPAPTDYAEMLDAMMEGYLNG